MQLELELLPPSVSIFVSQAHRSNADTILLAHFAASKRDERCADSGTGYGAIPLIWLARYEPAQTCGAEIQLDVRELVRQPTEHYGVADRL